MDEIRSSETLENEIRDDARRKADKILKDAAKECEDVARKGKERLEAELESLSERFRRKREAFRDETKARIPLERKRRRIVWAEGRMKAALDAALSAIGPAKLEAILLPRVEAALEAFSGKALKISLCALDQSSMIQRLKPRIEGNSCRIESSQAVAGTPGIEIETLDGSIRFHEDLRDLREELLDLRRGELAKALFGDLEAL